MFFGRVPVEFVPPGMTPEEARRQRKRQMGVSKKDVMTLIGLLLGFGALISCSVWWFFGRDTETTASTLEPSQLTATAVALAPQTPTLTPTQTSTLTPTPSPLPPTPTTTATATISLPESRISSPLASPKKLLLASKQGPVVTPLTPVFNSPLPTPTATREFDYEVIGHEITPEGLYSYVSGWIVEMDGQTPRPVGVRLHYPTGEMRYPRPNNTDIANGHYEFLASPGEYWLSVDDQGAPQIPVTIGNEPARHEISFRLVITRSVAVARSNPWSGPSASSSTAKTAPTATATKTANKLARRIFLPLVVRQGDYRYYLPVVVKNHPQLPNFEGSGPTYSNRVFLPLLIGGGDHD